MARVSHVRAYGTSARRAVARDTLTILGGGLLAVAAVQLLAPATVVGPGGSPTPPESGFIVGVGSHTPGPTMPPLDTLGPIVNSSIGIEASATPIPIITLGPPTPTPVPTATPRVTPRPTATHTASPIPTAAGSLPPPPLVAAFTCSPAAGSYTVPLDLTCTSTTTGATSWTWNFGDGPEAAGLAVQPHSYTVANNTYTIVLTVTDALARTDTVSQCCWSVTPTPTP